MERHLDDWLENYLYFTRLTESPTCYHLWSGLTAIASALRRKCFINWGLRGYIYPNMYVCLVGPPGGRKGTAMKIAKAMVHALGVPVGSDAIGSSQMLYTELKDSESEYLDTQGRTIHHKSLAIWSEEFQVFLSGQDPMIIPAITDLFDTPSVWKYSSLKQKTLSLDNCWLSIIGAITPQLLQGLLSREAVGGGLVSRIIFVVGYGAIKKVAFPLLSEEEYELKRKLEEDLEKIALLTGPFRLHDSFYEAYASWYEGPASEQGVDTEKLLGYNSRRALHLNKLAMLVSASQSSDMVITAKHLKIALAILEETEENMPDAFQGFGTGNHAELRASLLYYLEKHPTFTFPELALAFQMEAMPAELRDHLSSLQIIGKIRHVRTAHKEFYETIEEKSRPRQNTKILDTTLYRRIGRP